MATIPPEKIAQVRDRVDIERVIGRTVQLKRQGRRLVGRCPFHTEKTPSFSVDPQNKLYFCFGCHAGGDVFRFVQQLESVEFPEAVRILAREAGIELPDEEETPEARQRRELRRALLEANGLARAHFERMLWRDERAVKYLTEDRKLTQDTIRRFGIGFAPDDWESLAKELTRHGNAVVERAIELGLLGRRREGGAYDYFRGRILFPITLPAGSEIAGFGARRCDWLAKEGEEAGPKYLNSRESPVYDKSSIFYGLDQGRDAIRRSRRAILVEGYVDVIALHQADVREAIATCGTSLSPKHAAQLARLATEVITLYDGDAAGAQATRRAAESLLAQSLSVRVARLPEGEDPDTFVEKHGAQALEQRLKDAPSAIDTFVEEAARVYAGGGLAGLVKVVESVRPLILAVKDPLARDLYIEGAAKRLDIEVRVLRQHLGARGPVALREPPPPPPGPPREPAPAVSRPNGKPPPPPPTEELAILKHLIEQPELTCRALEAKDGFRAFTNEAVRAVVEAGRAAYVAGEAFDAHRALGVLGAHGGGEAAGKALLKTLASEVEEPLEGCVKHLLKNSIEHRIRELRMQIAAERDPEVQARLSVEIAESLKMKASLTS